MRRRSLALLVALLLIPASAFAQVAFDARSEGTGGGTSFSVSHVVGAGTNRVLYCGIAENPGDTDVSGVSAVYNTTETMTAVFTDTTSVKHLRIFRRTAPSTGTHNVDFSWSGGSTFAAVCASFTGVDQTTPEDTPTLIEDGSGGGTATTGNISSATNDMAVDFFVAVASIAGGLTVNGSQTLVNNQIGDADFIASSYEAGAASVSMDWTWTGFVSYAQWGLNINAAAAGGAVTPRLLLLGVGGAW